MIPNLVQKWFPSKPKEITTNNTKLEEDLRKKLAELNYNSQEKRKLSNELQD